MSNTLPPVQYANGIFQVHNSKTWLLPSFVHSVIIDNQLSSQSIRLEYTEKVPSIYPNFIAPLYAIADHYNLSIEVKNPYFPTLSNEINEEVLNAVFRYSDHVFIAKYIDTLIENLIKRGRFAKGVLESIDFCLGEIMDNAIRHSGKDYAFIMSQFHPRSQKLAICVVDNGVGPYHTLKHHVASPANTEEAILLALQKGMSTDLSDNLGFGLYGFHQLILGNGGQLRLSSDSVSIYWKDGSAKKNNFDFNLSGGNMGFIIDFELNIQNEVDYKKILGNTKPIYVMEREFETEFGDAYYPVKERVGGGNSRQLGKEVANELYNLAINYNRVYVDFKGIHSLSSGFADEISGKLMDRLGFVTYLNKITFSQANELVLGMLNHAFELRTQRN